MGVEAAATSAAEGADPAAEDTAPLKNFITRGSTFVIIVDIKSLVASRPSESWKKRLKQSITYYFSPFAMSLAYNI